MPRRALLNDINPHLINFYGRLKRGLLIEVEMRNDETLFCRHRVRFNDLLRKKRQSSREAASLFYFLNRTGYNGLCRFNSRGEFNVPFGRFTQIGYVRDFVAYKQMFGYAAMGVATWLVATAVRGSRRADAIRYLLVANGVLSIVGAACTAVFDRWVFSTAGLWSFAVWNALIPACYLLIAITRGGGLEEPVEGTGRRLPRATV